MRARGRIALAASKIGSRMRLHDRITQRFVDQRSTFLVRQLACDGELPFEVSEAGEIHVAGPTSVASTGCALYRMRATALRARMLIAAAGRVVRREVAARAHRLLADPDNAFAIDPTGSLMWRGGFVGRLVAGKRTLAPRAEPLAADFVEGELRERIRQRLQALSARGDRTAFIAAFTAQALSVGGNARGSSSSWSVRSVSCRQPRSVRRSRRSIPWIETRWVGRASASALRASISSRFFAPIPCAFVPCSGRCNTIARCHGYLQATAWPT